MQKVAEFSFRNEDEGEKKHQNQFLQLFTPTFQFSRAHETHSPPNNIDKLSSHARRVECNCNSVCTTFCFTLWNDSVRRAGGSFKGPKSEKYSRGTSLKNLKH